MAATARATFLGVTQSALASDSFLARRIDLLRSLKASVILGWRIPAGTGFVEHALVSPDCAVYRK